MVAPQNRPRKLLYLGIVAMIPVVFAIVVLIYSQINSADQARACQQEYQTVQDGLFAYMAGNNLAAVPATSSGGLGQSSGTNDMTSPVPLYTPDAAATSPTYIRTSKTRWSYTWDTEGTITAISQSGDGPSVPISCKISG
jgi:hypothetical protein